MNTDKIGFIYMGQSDFAWSRGVSRARYLNFKTLCLAFDEFLKKSTVKWILYCDFDLGCLTSEEILELSKNPELRKRMGQAGHERVVKHFQIKDQIKAFSDLYENITN